MQVKIKGTDEIINFPDNMAPEEIKAVLQRQFGKPRTFEQSISDALTPLPQTVEPYQPSMAENINTKIADFLLSAGVISDPYRAQNIAANIGGILGAAPVIGDAQAGDELGSALSQGDALGATLAGIGAIPLIGDFAKGAIKPVANRLNDALQAKIDADWDAAFKEYAQLPETKGGRLINTDEARELSPEYRADRTKAGDIHPAASAFTKQVYEKLLSEPVAEGREGLVRFMAGGAGAGKSTALKGGKFPYEADITYDTTLSKGAGDAERIEQALNSGRDAEIIHVYRDPIEAFENGVITRGKNTKNKPNGRIVPIKEVAKNHVGARKSIEYMAKRYADNPRVDLFFFDNSRGANKGDFVQSVEELPAFNYTAEQLESAYKDILDIKLADGFIDRDTYNKYLGK